MKPADEKIIAQAVSEWLAQVPKVDRERELANVISSDKTLQLRLSIAMNTINDRQDS